MSMLKILNEKGMTITEMIAGISLTGLLTTGFILVLVQFVTSFWELKEFNELQHGLVTAVLSMRNGEPNAEFPDEQTIGLNSAKTAKIASLGRTITIYPNAFSSGENIDSYWASYTYKDNGSLLYNAKLGLNRVHNKVIFPKIKTKIGKVYKYQITDLRFRVPTSPVNGNRANGNVGLVEIYIKGRVRFRERMQKQSTTDDLNQNTREAEFTNIVYLGNSDKE